MPPDGGTQTRALVPSVPTNGGWAWWWVPPEPTLETVTAHRRVPTRAAGRRGTPGRLPGASGRPAAHAQRRHGEGDTASVDKRGGPRVRVGNGLGGGARSGRKN